MNVRVLVLAAAVLTAAGCSSTPSEQKAATGPTLPSLELPSGGKIIAKVGDKEISEQALTDALASLPPTMAAQVDNPMVKAQLLDQLMTMEAIFQEAKAKGLDLDPTIQRQMRRAARSAMAQALFEQDVRKSLEATGDDELKPWFEQHADRYNEPEKVHARHILVTTAGEAKIILARLKKGADFVEEAKTHSTGPSAPQGGDLGFFTHDQMVPEFADAAFALKNPGDLSGVVKSQFGYHIIRLEEHVEAHQASFEEVRDKVKQDFIQSEQNRRTQTWMQSVRDAHPSVVLDESLKAAADQHSAQQSAEDQAQ